MSDVPHLTPDRQQIILNAIRAGSPKRAAFGLARYTVQAEDYWRKRAKVGAEPYASFCAALDAALAEAEDALVQIVRTAALEDAKHAQWLLERRFKWWAPRDSAPTEVATAAPDMPSDVAVPDLEESLRGKE